MPEHMLPKVSSSTQQNMHLALQTLEIDDSTKFANELMIADHNLLEMQLKLWILTLSSLSSSTELDATTKFVYDMRELAQKLGMDTKQQAWKTQVSNLCNSMIGPTIKIMQRYSNDEDKRHWTKMPIYKLIEFDGTKDKVYIMLNEQLYPYLQDFKSQFTEIEVRELLSIRGINPMRVYMLVKELMAEGRFSISVDLFKSRLGLKNSYSNFKDLQRYIIKAAEKQIRKNTSMHDFHFYHDGKGRRPATTLFFKVTPDGAEVLHEKEVLKEPVTFLDKLKLLTPEQRKYYELFIDANIRPEEKAYDLVLSYDIDVVRSNYAYYCNKKANRKSSEKPITPGYLVTCLQKDYAKKDRENLKKMARAAERTQSLNDSYKIQDQIENADREMRNRAGAFIHNAPEDLLIETIDRFHADIYATAELIGFNFSRDKAVEMIKNGNRKLTTREMNAIREVIAQQIKFGRLDPNQFTEYEEDSLFKDLKERVLKKSKKA